MRVVCILFSLTGVGLGVLASEVCGLVTVTAGSGARGCLEELGIVLEPWLGHSPRMGKFGKTLTSTIRGKTDVNLP